MRFITAQIKKRGSLPDNLPRFQDIESGTYIPAIVAADGTLSCTPDAAPHPGDCLVDRLTGQFLIALTGNPVVDRRGNNVYIDTPTIPAQLFILQRFDKGAVNAFGRPADPEPQTVCENVPVHIATSTTGTTGAAPEHDPAAIRHRATVPARFDIKQHDRLVLATDTLIVRAVSIAESGLRTLAVEPDHR